MNATTDNLKKPLSYSDDEDSEDHEEEEITEEEEEITEEEEETEAALIEEEDGSSTDVTTTLSSETDDVDESQDQSTSNEDKCIALQDYKNIEAGVLSLYKGEILTVTDKMSEHWWKVENSSHRQGLVPANLLRLLTGRLTENENETLMSSKSGASLWDGLRKRFVESNHQLVVNNEITSSSQNASILAELLSSSDCFSLKCMLSPKLIASGLRFHDLSVDIDYHEKMPVKGIQCLLNITACQQIPVCDPMFEVISRHIRICLLENANVCSNIHTVLAKWNSKLPKLWSFTKNITLNGSCSEEGNVFLKTENTSRHIGILFELEVSYRNLKTDTSGEQSCGWGFLKLYDEVGHMIKNGSYKIPVQNGSLSVHGQSIKIDFDAKLSMDATKKPMCVVVKISQPEGSKNEFFKLLPHTILGPVSLLSFISSFWQILNAMVKEQMTRTNGLIHAPALKIIANCFDQPDLMDILRLKWNEIMKQKASGKKDPKHLRSIFLDSILNTMCSLDAIQLPSYNIQNPQELQARKYQLHHIEELEKAKGTLATMLSPVYQYKCLNVELLSFDIVESHCCHIYT